MLHYSLTLFLLAKCSLIPTEVGPEQAFIDLVTRLSKEHGIQGRVILQAPGEARELPKDQGSQHVRDVFPTQTSVQFGFIPHKHPVEAETPVVTDRHDIYVRENIAEGHAEQDNVMPYPEPPVGRAAVNFTAGIQGNKASGNSKQKNQIEGPIRGAIQRQ